MKEEMIRQIVKKIVAEMEIENPSEAGTRSQTNHNTVCGIPVEASGRHVHLCQQHVEQLFGKGYVLTKKKDISQPGQYVCEERVTLKGPKGGIENVAVLGPVREKTQVEISMTDARNLGVKAPVKLSGDLKEAADIRILNGECAVDAKKAAIIAKIHLHINPSDAKRYMVHHGQHVRVTLGTDRRVTFHDVIVRADTHSQNALHIDYDEANACGFSSGDVCVIDHSTYCQQINHENDRAMPKDCKLVTESKMRSFFKNDCDNLTFKSGTILTPLAMDMAREKNIDIRFL